MAKTNVTAEPEGNNPNSHKDISPDSPEGPYPHLMGNEMDGGMDEKSFAFREKTMHWK